MICDRITRIWATEKVMCKDIDFIYTTTREDIDFSTL